MKRFGKHEELADLAVFLLSNSAAYINGECVVIDGGQWLRGAGEFNDLVDLSDEVWEIWSPRENRRPRNGPENHVFASKLSLLVPLAAYALPLHLHAA